MKYNYPKGERICVGHYDVEGNLRYITTSKPAGDYFYLYELKGEKFVKLGRDKNPKVLEEKYIRL